METVAVVEGPGLSQVERVVDTFVAPSKTFADILRSTSWWLPFLLFMIVYAFFAVAVDKKIGFEAVAEQSLQESQMMQDRMASLSPEVRAQAIQRQAIGTKYFSYFAGIVFLVVALFGALLNWATINFGFGAKTTFGQNYSMQMYASLPLALKTVVAAGLVFAGVGTDSFNMKNPIGTNPGFFMTDSAAWLKTLLTFFDVFSLWTLVLAIIGLACISGKTKGQAAIVVVGWWVLTMFVIVGITAATS
jgi:hypothetical protein